jgi:hypothetical protein
MYTSGETTAEAQLIECRCRGGAKGILVTRYMVGVSVGNEGPGLPVPKVDRQPGLGQHESAVPVEHLVCTPPAAQP